MQLIILKENLKRALNYVDKAINPNVALPILKNILIKTSDGKIKFSSNNLEIGINAFSLGKIIEEGSITVPYTILHNIVSNIESEKIILETDKNVLLLKTDNYQAKIQGINEKEFPLIPKIENTNEYIKVNGEVVKKALDQILPAIQISDIKPEISGMLFNFQLTFIKLVGTDTFRLIEKTLSDKEFESKFNNTFQVIIPLKTITELTKIIDEKDSIKIFVDQNQIAFQGNDWELVSRLIDGTYPDYEFIIPKELNSEIVLNVRDFFQALKLTSNFSGKINDIKIKSQDKKILKIYSSNPYLGENEYMLTIKMKGKELDEIVFNWHYLYDVRKIIDEDELFVGFNDVDKPVLFRPLNDKSVFYILMPIRLT